MVEACGASPRFIEVGGHRLFAALHPALDARRRLGVVMVHPYGDERDGAHRILRRTAEMLADRGFPTLRFDLHGFGDSDGEWGAGTAAEWKADLAAAIAHLRAETGVDAVALLGLRLGATLACLWAADWPEVRLLVLWAPLMRPIDNVAKLLRERLIVAKIKDSSFSTTVDDLLAAMREEGVVDLRGIGMAAELYDELAKMDLRVDPGRFTGRTLIMPLSSSAQRVAKVEKFRAALAAVGGQVEVGEASSQNFWEELGTTPNHLIRISPDHSSEALEQTVAWIEAAARSFEEADGATVHV